MVAKNQEKKSREYGVWQSGERERERERVQWRGSSNHSLNIIVSHRGIFSKTHLSPHHHLSTTFPLLRERERERESCGTGILFEEPNPTGSRPSDLIGLYRRWQPKKRRPQPAKRSSREGGGRQGLHCGEANPNQGWEGPQVKDPVPVVSVNPEADPPQPSAPVRQCLFKRETEHLCLRQPIHGIGYS